MPFPDAGKKKKKEKERATAATKTIPERKQLDENAIMEYEFASPFLIIRHRATVFESCVVIETQILWAQASTSQP